METLTPQQVRRVCTADSVSALVSDPQTAGAAPPGWHGLRYAALSGMDPYKGAGGIIAACVGLVFAAVEWHISQDTPLQSPVRCFMVWVV